MMRTALFLGVLAVGTLTAGCKTTTYVYVDAGFPVGHACPNGDECYGGTICVEGECTTTCTEDAECYGDTQCRPYPDAAGELMCVKVGYKIGPAMVGVSCAVDPNACAVDPMCDTDGCQTPCEDDSACSPGFRCTAVFPDVQICIRELFCRSRLEDDPDAYCTQECVTDRDCPRTLYCENIASDTDKNRRLCVPRKFCAPCRVDSDCDIVGGLCVPDSQGQMFCTVPCTPSETSFDPNQNTCPQPYSECKVQGDGRAVCQHRAGVCVGDGSLCSPCRTRGDCAANTVCYSNFYSKEQFCMSSCEESDCPSTDYMCVVFGNSCTVDRHCFAADGVCDVDTGECTPTNPAQCLKTFNLDTQTNPKYPTCYPLIAGPAG